VLAIVFAYLAMLPQFNGTQVRKCQAAESHRIFLKGKGSEVKIISLLQKLPFR